MQGLISCFACNLAFAFSYLKQKPSLNFVLAVGEVSAILAVEVKMKI